MSRSKEETLKVIEEAKKKVEKDIRKEVSRRWYERNKELAVERARKWREENREKSNEYARNQRKKDPERTRRQSRKNGFRYKYGMSVEQYDSMFDERGGLCDICGGAFAKSGSGVKKHDSLHVDHCHETKMVRGLLCHDCNVGMGRLKDSIPNLSNAIKYLERHKNGNS